MTSTPAPIARVSAADEAAILALNNEHAAELSWLEAERLSFLLGEAFYTRRIGDLEAFIMTFDQDARYDSPNFLWFRERYERFVYVDRVVVAAHARGRGHARRLYQDLFGHVERAGYNLVTCEV
ncbi:GNAT family N-acetyltransferase, partial [Mesorhizobium sp. M7A.F.Ca.ET.027.03.2.1]